MWNNLQKRMLIQNTVINYISAYLRLRSACTPMQSDQFWCALSLKFRRKRCIWSNIEDCTCWSESLLGALINGRNGTRISLPTAVLEVCIPSFRLGLGSETYLKMYIIAYFSPILLISTTPLVTCHESCVQNMKLTTSDLQEITLKISGQVSIM